MKLIKENSQDIQTIVEGKGKSKGYFIEGIFLQSDLKNQNGRIYPLNILQKEVKRYKENFIEHKRAFGELSHPDGPQINLDRVSHLIVDLKQEGKNFIGKAKVMDTPVGKIVKSFIDEGAKLGVSSRGVGSVKEVNGIQEVQEDFILATVDIVADPSAPEAFVSGIMEGKEYIYENGIIKEVDIEKIKAEILRTSSRNLEEVKIKKFKEFVSKLIS